MKYKTLTFIAVAVPHELAVFVRAFGEMHEVVSKYKTLTCIAFAVPKMVAVLVRTFGEAVCSKGVQKRWEICIIEERV